MRERPISSSSTVRTALRATYNWGSDFPHFQSIGLEAQSALHELLGTLPREDQEKMVGGNAAQVFNLD